MSRGMMRVSAAGWCPQIGSRRHKNQAVWPSIHGCDSYLSLLQELLFPESGNELSNHPPPSRNCYRECYRSVDLWLYLSIIRAGGLAHGWSWPFFTSLTTRRAGNKYLERRRRRNRFCLSTRQGTVLRRRAEVTRHHTFKCRPRDVERI